MAASRATHWSNATAPACLRAGIEDDPEGTDEKDEKEPTFECDLLSEAGERCGMFAFTIEGACWRISALEKAASMECVCVCGAMR